MSSPLLLTEFDFYLATTQRHRFHVMYLHRTSAVVGPFLRRIDSNTAASSRRPTPSEAGPSAGTRIAMCRSASRGPIIAVPGTR